MKVNEFIEKLKEALEFEDQEISKNTNLTEIDGFDSLSILSIISFIDENFGLQLTYAELNSITTVESLMEKIGKEKFYD